MHYVVLRDDDTNALTPVNCLERLYRPFLKRGMPINLAVIPEVCTEVKLPNGQPEGFLLRRNGQLPTTMPIGANRELVQYLLSNSGYYLAQHGCHHHYFEFDSPDRTEVRRRLDHGARLLQEEGFPQPETFIAPYDKLSPVSFREVAARFRVLSTGWFELRRLPVFWWPQYLMRKLSGTSHWQVGHTRLLAHPGCLLSCYRDYDAILDRIKETVQSAQLTVLVTHWWEYFRNNEPDERFIDILHQTAAFLDNPAEIKVVSFGAVASGEVPLN